jgi:hypothetical protein
MAAAQPAATQISNLQLAEGQIICHRRQSGYCWSTTIASLAA